MIRPSPVRWTRRQVLAAAVLGGVAGCAPAPAAPAPTATPTPAADPPGTTAGTTATPTRAAAALPRTSRWTPRRGEVRPAVKAVATSLVESAGAWHGALGGRPAAVRNRLSAAGFDPALAEALGPVTGPGAAAVAQVRVAQYGGILDSSASVLVVVDQWRLGDDGRVHPGGTTFDVRLVAARPRWRIVEVRPARPAARATSLPAAARRVLSDPRVRLPHAARADVASGRIDSAVLATLTSLAAEHVVDVSVVQSGHPLLVFGTGRRSDHPLGRAVDVWALDRRPLVLPSSRALAAWAMRAGVADGATNVGGPLQLDGPQFFTDDTHRDHVHLGFHRR